MFPRDLHTALLTYLHTGKILVFYFTHNHVRLKQKYKEFQCVSDEDSRMGGIHIIGAPTFFSEQGPARSKSGPECHSAWLNYHLTLLALTDTFGDVLVRKNFITNVRRLFKPSKVTKQNLQTFEDWKFGCIIVTSLQWLTIVAAGLGA